MNRVSYEKKMVWLPWLTNRLAIFFFYLSVVAFLLYLLGNFQNFADSTQFFLFDLISLCCYGFFCFMAAHVILSSFVTVRRHARGRRVSLRFILMTIGVLVLYFSVHFIFVFISPQ